MQFILTLAVELLLTITWVILLKKSFSKNNGGRFSMIQVIFAVGIVIIHIFIYPDEGTTQIYYALLVRALTVWCVIAFVAMFRAALIEYREVSAN